MYTYSQVTVILKNETSLKETLKYKEEYIDFRGREHLVTRPSYYYIEEYIDFSDMEHLLKNTGWFPVPSAVSEELVSF